jgi:predicted polyphosphate/ATP-dependent NAD kinase
MRVLVCGARDWRDRGFVYRVLDTMHAAKGFTLVITGGALGADLFGKLWAQDRRIATDTFQADWTRLGLAAGPIRNQRMIEEGKPDLVVAFPGGKGTADMVARADRAGVPVEKVGWR